MALGIRAAQVAVCIALGIMVLAGCAKAAPHVEPLKVAAASDLTLAFGELGPLYEKATQQPVVFSFGATGMLERQIVEGAPFDVFAAANASFADDAVASGACLADSRTKYATGRIVLYAGTGAPLAPKALADLTDARIRKIAIANPDHAPYGHAAKVAMQRAGIWDAVSREIVYGENVQQTMQFAQSGNVDVAIVGLSLVITSPGTWTLVPAELHDPLDQVMVACTHGKAGPAAGRRFIEFVRSDTARAVMHKYGLDLEGGDGTSP
jgi:molybdate transport system substrate-binding protein